MRQDPPDLAHPTGPAPSLPTCLVVTGRHPTPMAVPGPALLCLFGYLRCLPCLPCCHPTSQLTSALGRPLLLLPDSPKASKRKKNKCIYFSVLIYYLWPSKNTERRLIRAQSDERKKNRVFLKQENKKNLFPSTISIYRIASSIY